MFQTKEGFITGSKLIINELGRFWTKLKNVYFANNEQESIAVFIDVTLSILGKWKSAIGKGKYCGVLLTDLSKAFDCISQELLLAKKHSYSFSLRAL